MQSKQMHLPVIGILDGPVIWVFLSLVCLIGVPIAIIVVIVLLGTKQGVRPLLNLPDTKTTLYPRVWYQQLASNGLTPCLRA